MTRRTQDSTLRMLRSSFGAQPLSGAESAPAAGFGSSCRDAALKTYLSKEHARKTPGNNSMGAIYKIYSSLGPQPDSARPSSGTMAFGTAQRLPRAGRGAAPGPGQYRVNLGVGQASPDSRRGTEPRAVFGCCTRDGQAKVYLDAALMRTYYGKESPPPGRYDVPSAIGRQAASTRETAPAARIGTARRGEDYARARHLPGPGAYAAPSGVGRQALSAKASPLAHTFGRGTREAITNKALISKAHEKAKFGEATPGPATAAQLAGVGPQLLSTRPTSPGWGFGTAKRLKAVVSETPGVGSYWA